MAQTKQVVPVMLDNLWWILERSGALMNSFAANFGLEQYVWTLPNIPEGATEDEVVREPHIWQPKMPLKVDEPIVIIPVIAMGHP